ncbi:MAG TPA: DsrE family protein [Armatimonadaceae bacterium]|nr:DsrE family protein [Armatimonadaceae bacterium]
MRGGVSRVVIDASVGGAEYADALLRNVENLRAALGPQGVEAEVVVYGKALPMLLRAGNAAQASRMQKLAQGGGVRFVACENSMRRARVTREALFPFAGTVDSGVAQLVRRQAAGWAYLKPGG